MLVCVRGRGGGRAEGARAELGADGGAGERRGSAVGAPPGARRRGPTLRGGLPHPDAFGLVDRTEPSHDGQRAAAPPAPGRRAGRRRITETAVARRAHLSKTSTDIVIILHMVGAARRGRARFLPSVRGCRPSACRGQGAGREGRSHAPARPTAARLARYSRPDAAHTRIDMIICGVHHTHTLKLQRDQPATGVCCTSRSASRPAPRHCCRAPIRRGRYRVCTHGAGTPC